MNEAPLPFPGVCARQIIKHSPRPARDMAFVTADAIAELAKRCMDWDEAASTPEDWIAVLTPAVAGMHDGYEIARYLDDHSSVSPDAELVEILDSWTGIVAQAQRTAVATWVALHNIIPELAEGDACRFDGMDGVIVQIDRKHACYTVSIAAFGHLSAGERAAGVLGTSGLVLPYESVEAE
ncbi:MAG: hypothetical protein J0H82_05985 [Alphaproteobacteria bacterium]|jgi:hypothetical protein|nr:hypothetical protein [Alphaproteobacteria bacterium]